MTMKRALLSLMLVAILARPAAAAPGAATLIAPYGDVAGSTIAFSWEAAAEATWYLLWIGTPNAAALVHQQWYTAQQAGCPTGGTCTIVFTPPLVAGGYVWFVQTYGTSGYGAWSAAKTFTFRDPVPTWSRILPDNRRFTLVLNDLAVLDNESGLTWQRTPGNATSWIGVISYCVQLNVAGRYGWRPPTIEELSTLGQSGQSPGLPPGHPFALGAASPSFWSQTQYADTANVLVGHFGSSLSITQQPKTDSSWRSWCVRAPTGATR